MKTEYKNVNYTEEEWQLAFMNLEMLLDKCLLLEMRLCSKYEDKDGFEKFRSFREYFKSRTKGKRLEPSGETNGVMFIGVNPSEKSNFVNIWEDTFGKYFGKMLTEADIDIKKVWMSNIYKHPTPGNRPLTDEEIEKSVVELKSEISFVKPKIIVTLGNQPRDIVRKYFGDNKVINLPHPSYIMRMGSEDLRSKYLLELNKLKKYE